MALGLLRPLWCPWVLAPPVLALGGSALALLGLGASLGGVALGVLALLFCVALVLGGCSFYWLLV